MRLKLRNLVRLIFSLRVPLSFARKARADRILLRAGALAFQTLLSMVPLSAVGMAAVRRFGGEDSQEALLRFVVSRYVPAATGEALDSILPLVRGLDLRAVGLVGLAALLPLMLALVDAVELTISDMFGTRRRGHLWRVSVLGVMLTIAPFAAVLTVRYGPWKTLTVDDIITPLGLTSVVLYGGFRLLPNQRVSQRAAAVGALSAGLLLSASKAGFGLYAVYLARSIHVVYGAIAFVPLLLLWVLTAWLSVLLGAEVTTVLHRELNAMEAAPPVKTRDRHAYRHRLHRRVARRRKGTTTRPPPPL